jgi:hypothetical protein
LSLRFKTLIVLTLRYQRAAFRRAAQSLRPFASKADGDRGLPTKIAPPPLS